jgi:hypothetical protein
MNDVGAAELLARYDAQLRAVVPNPLPDSLLLGCSKRYEVAAGNSRIGSWARDVLLEADPARNPDATAL